MINTRERFLIYLREKKGGTPLLIDKFVSLRRKILMFGALSISIAGIAIILVTYKNFLWTAENVLILPVGEVIASVLKETLFVIGIFLGLVIKLIVNYSRNLSLYFSLLVQKMDQIAQGNYDKIVPIFSHDEFALLINHVNHISGELKEKQKIQSMFGKLVSPGLAARLMEGDMLELGGFEDDVIVMFADIRNFTSFSEQSNAGSVIKDLNAFHTKMVEVIMKHNGIIDKFLGDGIMAVFGVESKENVCEDAVLAAVEMQKVVKELFTPSIRIGIGLHKGDAIIGLVGSPDRLEFTVIGDTVNTASRLETATKQLKCSALISGAIYDKLAGEHTENWQKVGFLNLKGKEEKILAYAYELQTVASTL